MYISVLVVGGNSEKRRAEALSLASENSSGIDTKVFDSNENSGIAAIKDFVGELSIKPFNSSVQTAVILDSHLLTLEAQNALLKTIEEPTKTTRIVLTAPNPQSLISTITSRCEMIELTEHQILEKGDFSALLAKDFYKRWSSSEHLDLDSWTGFWRASLHEKILEGDPRREDQKKILNYLKVLQKAKQLEKKRVSKKLLNTFVLLSPPLGQIA